MVTRYTVTPTNDPADIIAVTTDRDEAVRLSRQRPGLRVRESDITTPRIPDITPERVEVRVSEVTPDVVERDIIEVTPDVVEVTPEAPAITPEDIGFTEPNTPFQREALRVLEIDEILDGDALEVRARIAQSLGFDPDLVQSQFEDAAGRHPESRRVQEEIFRLRDERIALQNKYESSSPRLREALELGIDLPPVGAGVVDRPQNLDELRRSLGVEELPDPNSAEFIQLVQSELGLSPNETAGLVRDLTQERLATERTEGALAAIGQDFQRRQAEDIQRLREIAEGLGLNPDAYRDTEALRREINRVSAGSNRAIALQLGLSPDASFEEINAAVEVIQQENARRDAALSTLTDSGVAIREGDQYRIDTARGRELGLTDEMLAIGLTQRQIDADLILERQREADRVSMSRLALGEASQAFEAAQVDITPEPQPIPERPIITETTLDQALSDAELRLERASLAASSAPGPEGPTANEYQRVQDIQSAITQVEAGDLTEEQALLNLGLARVDIPDRPNAPRSPDDFNTFEQIIAALIPFDMERPTRQGVPLTILPPGEWSPDAELRQLYQEASTFNLENFPSGTYAPATFETVIVGPNPDNLTVEEVESRLDQANQEVEALNQRLQEIQVIGAPNIGQDLDTGLPTWIGTPEALVEYETALEEHNADIEAYNQAIATLPQLEVKPTVKTSFEQIRDLGASLTPGLGTVVAYDALNDNWNELNKGEKIVGTGGVAVSAAADAFLLGGLLAKPLAATVRGGVGRSLSTRNPITLRQTIQAQRNITDNFVSVIRKDNPALVPTSRRMLDDFADHTSLAAIRENTATRLLNAQEKLARSPLPDGSDILNVRVLSDRLQQLDQAIIESRAKLQASSREFGQAVRDANIGKDVGINYQSGQLTSLNEAINDLPSNMVRIAESASAKEGINETIADLQRQLTTANRLLEQAETRYAQAATVSLDDAQQLSALRQNKVAIEARLKDALLGDVEALNKERLIVQNDLTILRKARAEGRQLTERETIDTQRFRSVEGIPAAEQRLSELSASIDRQLRSWDDMIGKPLSPGGTGRVLAPERPVQPQIRGELGGFTAQREVPFLQPDILPIATIGGLGSLPSAPIGAVEAPERELPGIEPERIPFDPFTAPTVPEPTEPFPSPSPRVSPDTGPRQTPVVSPFPEIPPAGPFPSPVQEPSRRFAPERPPAPLQVPTQEPGQAPSPVPTETPTEFPFEQPADAPAEFPARRDLPATSTPLPTPAPATLPVQSAALRIQAQIQEATGTSPDFRQAPLLRPVPAIGTAPIVEADTFIMQPPPVTPPIRPVPPDIPRRPRIGRANFDNDPFDLERDAEGRLNLRVVGLNRGFLDTGVDLVTGEAVTYQEIEGVPENHRIGPVKLSYSEERPKLTRVRYGFHDALIDEQGNIVDWVKPQSQSIKRRKL